MWESSVWMCFQLTEREREAGGDFYIYECVRQQHKSSTGLLHRGEPHQKCQSSAICSRLKLCNCNSVERFLTIRSMLEWIHSQTHAIHLHTWTNAHSSNKDTDESWDVELQWEMYVFVCLLACLFFYQLFISWLLRQRIFQSFKQACLFSNWYMHNDRGLLKAPAKRLCPSSCLSACFTCNKYSVILSHHNSQPAVAQSTSGSEL